MNEIEFLKSALQEDVAEGDHSSLSTIPSSAKGKAHLLVKEAGIISGIDVAKKVFDLVDPDIQLEIFIRDGDQVSSGDIVFIASGSSQNLLKAERLMLNLMQRMSGIATTTHKYVQLTAGTKAKVLDTRKTTPNLRAFEKQAVVHGGGTNHRFGLYDMIMIKDNHIDFAGGIAEALTKAHNYIKKNKLELKIEIEARDLDEVRQVLDCGLGDRIMLDNFNYEDTRIAVELINGQYETESSGGITLDTIANYAKCGVDYVSVGALTHSVKSLDLSFKAIN
ncbi:carboxylating nicotinate-nucleotide diphosphorylase [bacterium SCSIO 12643]|nr:carboxylating nicotinate-nucleotide diphosphorylase [bacterium SCSIO 12643]